MNIGPYRLARLVSEGGQGTVYEARDQRFGRKVAVKLMALPKAREDREMIVEEALVLAGFYHRSAVQIFDVVETKTHLAIVMEYIPGTDLSHLQEQGDLSLLTLLQLLVDLCAGLSALHRRGFVHRDLKASNVLLDRDGVAQLTDFGIAVPLQSLSIRERRAVDLAGTYYAMSPEHARGETVDQRSDVFALGLILFRALAGQHPFPWRGDSDEFLQRLLSTPHPALGALRPDIPKSLVCVVDKALAKDPADRHYTAMELRHELQAVVNGMPRVAQAGLLQLVAANARPEKGRPLLRRRPAGRFRDARSRLMSRKDWGPWGFSNKGLYRGMVISGVGLVIFMGLIQLAVNFLTAPDWRVRVLPSIVMADELSPPQPTPQELVGLVTDAVNDLRGIRVVERSADDKLYSRLRCNYQLCQLQLTLDRGADLRTEYLSIMADAQPEVWREVIDATLEEFFATLPER